MYPTQSQSLQSLNWASNLVVQVSAELVKYLKLPKNKFCFSIPWMNKIPRPATYSLNRKSPSTPIKNAEIFLP